MTSVDKKLIVIGASGHGKVILDIALQNGYQVLGFLDDNPKGDSFIGYPMLGTTENATDYREEAEFVIAIGSNRIREMIAERLNAIGVQWATLIHPTATVGMGVVIGAGTVVMAGAVINPFAEIGCHCIVNTSAVIEHDNRLADYVHVSPAAALAGTVEVGTRTHVGIGACIRNNITVCKDCMIGAGAAVVVDLTEPGTYVGVPAKMMK